MKVEGGGDVCILDGLNKQFMHSEYCYKNKCYKCILEWLDKDFNNE